VAAAENPEPAETESSSGQSPAKMAPWARSQSSGAPKSGWSAGALATSASDPTPATLGSSPVLGPSRGTKNMKWGDLDDDDDDDDNNAAPQPPPMILNSGGYMVAPHNDTRQSDSRENQVGSQHNNYNNNNYNNSHSNNHNSGYRPSHGHFNNDYNNYGK
jgi:hypothetical protein